MPVLLAPTLGPTFGGLLTDSSFGWPAIFFINVPVGIIALALVARVMRPQEAPEPGAARVAPASTASFDWGGLILSMVGVVLVVYAFTLVSQTDSATITALNPRGDIHGWGYWLVWTLLGIGIATLAAFSYYELRVANDPVLDLRLFADFNFSIATVMTWVTRAVIFGSFFLVPLFLQQFRDERGEGRARYDAARPPRRDRHRHRQPPLRPDRAARVGDHGDAAADWQFGGACLHRCQ